MHPDVLFVGAGPVGLFAAILAKLNNPSQHIMMFERHSTYARQHILVIDPKSYQGTHPDPRFQAILRELKGPVLTTKIEEGLRGFALELGIEIEHKTITNIQSLATQYPSAHTIVGADGAKSLVRRELFGNEITKDDTYQYIVELKYKTQQKTYPLSLDATLAGLSQIPHFVSEHVGKFKNNETPVSLFFFVDKKTHYELETLGANASTGLRLADIRAGSQPMTEMANSILPWLAYRRAITNEIMVSGSEKISAIALKTYKSKSCVKEHHGVRYVLVGDAALGVPYFRALNAGFIGGIKAARLVSRPEALNPYKNNAFEADMLTLAKAEINTTFKKNLTVNLGKFFAGFTFIGLRGSIAETMPTKHIQAMLNARVSALPFYQQRHSVLISIVLWSIALTVAVVLTSGIASIPIIGALLALNLSPLSASAAAATSIALIGLFIQKSITSIISYMRTPKEPRTHLEIEYSNPLVSKTTTSPPETEDQGSPRVFQSPLSSGQFPWQQSIKTEDANTHLKPVRSHLPPF